MKITLGLGSPDPGYSGNRTTMIYVLGCDLARDELRSHRGDEALGEQEIELSES